MDRVFDEATATPARRNAGMAVLVALALPLVYYSHYLWARMSMANLNPAQLESYAGDLLGKALLPARVEGRGLVALKREDVSAMRDASCQRSIRRDPARDGLFPRYTQHHACRATFDLKIGGQAEAAFDLVMRQFYQELYEGPPEPYLALTSEPPPLADVKARLCGGGGC
jgi:hypothetical protein